MVYVEGNATTGYTTPAPPTPASKTTRSTTAQPATPRASRASKPASKPPRTVPLEQQLADLEATDPTVAAAARSLDRATETILQKPPTPAEDLAAHAIHVTELLRATHQHPHPIVASARTAALAALEALHLAHDLTQTPATAAPPTRAAAGPTSAGPREGEAQARRTTTRGHSRRGVTIDEPAVVEQYRAGDTRPTLAKRHSTTSKRITSILERHHVDLRDDRATHSGGRNRFKPTPEQVADIRRLYVDQQKTVADIGDQFGIHRRVIARILTDAGVTIRPAAHLTGTVITDTERTAIADRYAAGESMAVLADEHHVRRQTIRAIVTAAGHEIRSKGNSTGNRRLLEQLGVDAPTVRAWARNAGHDVPGTGLIPSTLISAYDAAHPNTSSTTNPTGAPS